jgi:hypothetical protein
LQEKHKKAKGINTPINWKLYLVGMYSIFSVAVSLGNQLMERVRKES